MTLPVTTRLLDVAARGLDAVLAPLSTAGVPAVVLESPSGRGLEFNAAALAQRGVPILGAIGVLTDAAEAQGGLASVDSERRRAALVGLEATARVLGPLRANRLIIPMGAAGLPGELRHKDAFAAGAPDAADLWRAHLIRTRDVRAAHAELICRDLFALSRRLSGCRMLLLAAPNPFSFLDIETAGWILDDLRATGLSLAVDLGATEAAGVRGAGSRFSEWMRVEDRRLGFLLVSDHDDRGGGAILPGAGLADFTVLRDVLVKAVPRALRPDPGVPLGFVLAALKDFEMRYGPIGDLSAW